MVNDIPLKPENSTYTDGQWQSIYDSGQNILVSASAGSGKTTVLVQRVIEKIKMGLNVDELLIVTYTEAAAREMKERILGAVQKAISEELDDTKQRHLVNQLSKIPNAPISTLHAFCLKVIRKYYYLIEIDPVFRLLTDETEMLLLKEEAWDELRESLYEKEAQWFYPLTENFSNDRQDDGLTQLVYSAYEFSRANPNPKKWLDSLVKNYDVTDDFSNLELYQHYIKPDLIQQFQEHIKIAKEVTSAIEGEPVLASQFEKLQAEQRQLETLFVLLNEDKLEEFYESLQAATFATYSGPRGKEVDPLIKEAFEGTKAARNSNKDFVKKTLAEGVFNLSPKENLEILAKAKPYMERLGELTNMFDKAYTTKKNEKNVLDFNDLEHLTLKILTEEKDGSVESSPASLFYREQFKEVLVDEYQDINQLQENILFWLRQPDDTMGNFFMVGDVKQSIYSFRLADPTLFIGKYNQYATEKGGRRIVLAENFRSRGEVLSFTNYIFRQIMNTSVGQLEYDKQAQLINGFKGFPESPRYQTEILIYENGETTLPENDVEADLDESLAFQIDDKTEGEIRLIGQKIKELRATGFQVYDKKQKEMRHLDFRDIVILTPTKKNNLVLLDLFKEMDLPLYINDTQNYFQATEIKIIVALLNVIDNPYQDIPLAAVLRSPIVGLSENELAMIKLSYREGNFYEALQVFVRKEGTDDKEVHLQKRLNLFMKQLNHWREMSRRKRLVELIWAIYDDTGFLSYVAGLPSGKQRQANLHALYERAMSYENSSFKGLFQFVKFIEKMQQKNKDLAEPSSIGEDEDAIRVMTIHASKGLEFPVVFIMDLNRGFNTTSLKGRYIFDEKLGGGIKYTDSLTRLEYKTLPYSVITAQKSKKMLAEEMRKLYVGLTRAEEKLFLVGSYKDQETALKNWQEAASVNEEILPDTLRMKAKSLMDWIGYSLVRHENMKAAMNDVTEDYRLKYTDNEVRFTINFTSLNDLKEAESATSDLIITAPQQTINRTEPQIMQMAKNILAFEYPFQAATKTASYQSVSEIKKVFADPDVKELLSLEIIQGQGKIANRFVEETLAKPKFLSEEQGVTAAEIGTATHLVLQLLPLEKRPTQSQIETLIQGLVMDNVLDEKVAKKIKVEQLLRFFETDFGEALVVQHESVKREQPFSMLLKANQIYKEFPKQVEDEVLIHGIIDGFIETEKELILFDFKTDVVGNHYDEATLGSFKEKYRGQLMLYKKALEIEKKRPVTGIKLILLEPTEILEME